MRGAWLREHFVAEKGGLPLLLQRRNHRSMQTNTAIQRGTRVLQVLSTSSPVGDTHICYLVLQFITCAS
eukprot:g20002.t1